MSTLIVAALAEEVAALPAGLDVLELGVGKLSTSTRLAAHLHTHDEVDQVVNIGTAGGLHDQALGTVVEVARVVQHDLDVDGISALVGRSMPGGPLDLDADGATVATGDRFVTAPAERDRLAAIADLVDMEAYAVVATCRAFGVPVRVVKCVSDGADDRAVPSWQEALALCASRLATWVGEAGLATGT